MLYPVVIEPGTDDIAFGVVFPDLPGGFSAGDTLDEPVGNATEAAALWIKDAIDRDISMLSSPSLNAISTDPQWNGRSLGSVTIAPALFDIKAERVGATRARCRRNAIRLYRDPRPSGLIARTPYCV